MSLWGLIAVHAYSRSALLMFATYAGGSREGYCKAICAAAAKQGWRAAVLNYRGCAGRKHISPPCTPLNMHILVVFQHTSSENVSKVVIILQEVATLHEQIDIGFEPPVFNIELNDGQDKGTTTGCQSPWQGAA